MVEKEDDAFLDPNTVMDVLTSTFICCREVQDDVMDRIANSLRTSSYRQLY